MRLLRLTALAALLTVLLGTVATCDGQPGKERRPFVEYWTGVYKDGLKIGFMHTAIRRDTFEGKEVFHKEDALSMRMRSSDSAAELNVTRNLYVDLRFELVLDTYMIKVKAPKEDSKSKDEYEEHLISVETRGGRDGATTKMICDGKVTEETCPSGSSEDADHSYEFGGRRLSIGARWIPRGFFPAHPRMA